jgi:UDP-glucose 4-epimerase|tara:strand:+ start:7 stop:930 length:924 start_codon:yes stop_codon:yes gene_type:complete
MQSLGKVLVTGGAGFIGTELVEQLYTKGYEVTILDKQDKPMGLDHVKYIQGDLSSPARCVMACAGQDYVIHLAAKARIPESFINPDEYFESNVVGTRNILTAASAVGIRKFVYAGSSSVYGNNTAPNKPNHKPDPLNYYAMTKLFGEHLCKQYKIMFNLNYNILRFFTVYSENQPNTNTGGLMIGKFARLAKEGEPLTIHGDGEFKRDYIHVTDVARALIASIESKVKNDTFNVGTGKSVSVNTVVEVLKTFVPDLTTINVEKPRGYAPETLADISKTKNLLNWSPKISILPGLSMTFEEIFKRKAR